MPRVSAWRFAAALVWTALLVGTGIPTSRPPGQLKSPPSVGLHVYAGFSGQMRRPWSPVTVMVVNAGSEPLRGELLLEAEEEDGFRARREIYVGPSSTKRVTFYSPVTTGWVRLLAAGAKASEARFSGGGTPYGYPDRLLVVVGKRSGFLRTLEQGPDWSGAGREPSRTVVGVRDLTRLPERWVGYSGVWAVVLSGVDFDRFSPLQQQALLGWVETGGLLVISPGSDIGWLVRPPWDELLRLQSPGSEQREGAPVLERLYGRFEGSGKFLLHHLRSDRARLVGPEVGGWPSYLGIPVGAGMVVVTAFDAGGFPFRGWSGSTAFWESLLTKSAGALPDVSWRKPKEWGWGSEATEIGAALKVLSALTARPTPVLLIGALATLYVLCVGPLNYLLLRDYRKRVWVVVTIPAVALAFVVLVGTIGLLGRGLTSLLEHVTLLVVHGEASSAYQRSYIGVWSPVSQALDLETSGEAFLKPLTKYPWADIWRGVGAVEFGQRNRLADCRFRVNELRCFQLDAVRPLGGSLRLLRQGADLVLVNDTDLELRGAHIRTATGSILFGDLAPGESRQGRREEERGPGRSRRSRQAWLRMLAPDLLPGGSDLRSGLAGSLWSLVDMVSAANPRFSRGQRYRVESAVSNLQCPVQVRGGRVRLGRELVLLEAYLTVSAGEAEK